MPFNPPHKCHPHKQYWHQLQGTVLMMKMGQFKNFKNCLTFLVRPTQFDKIHLVKLQHKKTLPKSFCKKCKGLIIKKQIVVPFHRHGCDSKQTLYQYVSKFTLCFTKFLMNLKKITMKKWFVF